MHFIRRLRGEEGMTIIEVMVAAVICAVGIMATVGVMDASRKTSVRSEYRDVMAHQAERELERIMELPWANLAHNPTVPTTSPWAGTPSGVNFQWDRADTSKTEPLLASGNGQVSSTWTAWDDNAQSWNNNQTRLSGRVYRFITTIGTNSRRVTVVVTGSGENPPPPVLLSSIKTQPLT
jgi:Tfp pilus assembly protein PilV